MIEIEINLRPAVKKVYNLTDDEYETLLQNLEPLKRSIKAQIEDYIVDNLIQVQELKEEIEKEIK